MTWFSLPSVQPNNKAAFSSARSATNWLAAQPQANSLVMLGEFLTQIRAFNTCDVRPAERFKTMSVLRKALFAVSGDCQRRYENKPLPLLPAEYSVLDAVCALWHECTIAYLHCLRACLDGDSRMVLHSAKVAHRAMACLRMEQMNRYLGGAEVDGEFWRNLHSVMASAESLNAERNSVEDPLLGETKDSTVSGQYCMALMLHLSRPYSLSRAQFAAVIRWLARWREQARVRREPEKSAKATCIALDLAADKPLHDNLRAPKFVRWLSIGSVLRKISERLKALEEGESPENLKLGSGLSAEACSELLTILGDNLKCPQPPETSLPAEAPTLTVAVGLENIYRVLGGSGLKEASAAFGNRLSQDQIAVFDHVVQVSEEQGKTEYWRQVRQDRDELHLYRPNGAGEGRLSLRNLILLQAQPSATCQLAMVSSLYSRSDGSVRLIVRLYPGAPLPLLMEMREKVTARTLRYPSFMLPKNRDNDTSVILPAGICGRASSIRFLEAREHSSLPFRLGSILERGSDNERYVLDAGR